jgi:hypothetical protein
LRGFVFDKPSPTAATMVSGSSQLWLAISTGNHHTHSKGPIPSHSQ